MGFAAFIYVETLTNVDVGAQREADPRCLSFVFGSASGNSPTADAAARRWHQRLKLAPNQRVVFVQTDRHLIKRIDKAIEKAKDKGQTLPWLDAYQLVKSRLRPKRQHQHQHARST